MDDIITELRLLDEHYDRMFGMVRTYMDENTRQHKDVWEDLAELRDDVHAVANRVENLTKALTTDAAEVAARIVTDANRGLRDATND